MPLSSLVGKWTLGRNRPIVDGAIRRLNDYIGYRPIAVLEGRKHEPYLHEWVRPIPLYIDGVGVAYGPYYEIISTALQDPPRDRPGNLEGGPFFNGCSFGISPRPKAYDFDHPVNKRPNYHFGQWDPNLIDLDGNYRRFVIQQVCLDALMARLREERDLPANELVVKRLRPGWHDVDGVWNIRLWPQYLFVEYHFGQLAQSDRRVSRCFLFPAAGSHERTACRSVAKRRIPAASTTRRGKTTLEYASCSAACKPACHVQLARLFARMGSPLAAKEESDDVHVPSARILCRIDCLLTMGNQALKRGDLEQAVTIPEQIDDLIQRGIECGALVDPWNILGFAGNFNRFHGPDSAVHDHRVDELVHLLEQVFVSYRDFGAKQPPQMRR